MSESSETGIAQYDENRPFYQLIEKIGHLAEANPMEAFDIASIVIDKIANATTPEEIFAANEQGPADVADYIGRRLGLLDARFAPSAERFRRGTLGYYVVFDAIDDGGEKVTISCGAPNVVASIYGFYEMRLFSPDQPFFITIRSRDTGEGRTLYTVHAG